MPDYKERGGEEGIRVLTIEMRGGRMSDLARFVSVSSSPVADDHMARFRQARQAIVSGKPGGYSVLVAQSHQSEMSPSTEVSVDREALLREMRIRGEA